MVETLQYRLQYKNKVILSGIAYIPLSIHVHEVAKLLISV